MTEQTIAQKVAQRKADLLAAQQERAQLQALDVLISSCPPQPAPRRIDLIDPTYKIVTIGVGRDHTVTILATASDIEALDQLLGGEDE